jgi:hypothetical protein
VATTEARLSGFSGPRVSGTARPSVSLVGTVLDAASVGDLLVNPETLEKPLACLPHKTREP